MAAKWDDSRSSRDAFNKAAQDQSEPEKVNQKPTEPPEGPGLDRGPTPPGGHPPRNTPWDAQKEQRGNDVALPNQDKSKPDLKRDFDKNSK